MGNVPCNTLQFNTQAVMSGLLSYYIGVMDKIEERTIDVMQKELEQNGKGPRASSARIDKWKSFVSRYIKKIQRVVAKDYIESTIGVETRNEEVYRKAIIIAAGGHPKYAGPLGRIVWDENYTAQHPSNSKRRYKLPSTWKLNGNSWVDNSAKKMKVYFFDSLDLASQALPDTIFSDNLIVS